MRYQVQVCAGNLREGDVLMTNHPVAGGTHLPDITVITPVFAGGVPVFFVASRGHHADIGGITPGSMPPHSKALVEEGMSCPTPAPPPPRLHAPSDLARPPARRVAHARMHACTHALTRARGRAGAGAWRASSSSRAASGRRRVSGRCSPPPRSTRAAPPRARSQTTFPTSAPRTRPPPPPPPVST